jgi:hypothetical protein
MLRQAVARLTSLDAGLVRRAGVVIGIYVLSALALLGTLLILRGAVSASALRATLAFFFVSATASGLEPGTVKAAALHPQGAFGRSSISYAAASTVKAFAISPVIGLVWRFADPATPLAELVWLPLICAVGFTITDLRVLLDLQGRHAQALALKQGVMAGGHVLTGLALILGLPLYQAIGLSTVARLAFAATLSVRLNGRPRANILRETGAMLADPRWVEFAATSGLGSASGSADRVFGLRYLPAGAYGAYYLTFEALSRFWLIPYLLTPVLFARRVGGQEASRLTSWAWALTALAGAGLVAVVAVVVSAAPDFLQLAVGARLGAPTVALAVAVVLASLAQLKITELQAAGRSRLVLAVTGVIGVISAAAFFVGAFRYGAAGLMYAWVVRAAIELTVLIAVGYVGRGPRGAAGRARPEGSGGAVSRAVEASS